MDEAALCDSIGIMGDHAPLQGIRSIEDAEKPFNWLESSPDNPPEKIIAHLAVLAASNLVGQHDLATVAGHPDRHHGRQIGAQPYPVKDYPEEKISSQFTPTELCRKKDVGVIAMKALGGGLLRSPRAAFAFLRQHENIVPIWGIQRMDELEKLLALDAEDPCMDAVLQAQISRDRAELSGSFCRACGYCLLCPANIPIPIAARMHLLLRRMPAEAFRSDEWRKDMRRIDDCTKCGHCRKH